MSLRTVRAVAAIAIPFCLAVSGAQAATDPQLQTIRAEIRAMKQAYEARIMSLENKIRKLEETGEQAVTRTAAPSSGGRAIKDNSFNPSIGVVLNGQISSLSLDSSSIAGFGAGEEGERGSEGLAIDESEINISANVDDKFYGSLTAALVREDGSDKVELEEANVQTLPISACRKGRA